MHTPLLICVACKKTIWLNADRVERIRYFACCIMAGNVYIGAMTTTTATNGRLCNQIIRNLASLLRRSTICMWIMRVAVQFVLWV
jgi:hypothetical protein